MLRRILKYLLLTAAGFAAGAVVYGFSGLDDFEWRLYDQRAKLLSGRFAGKSHTLVAVIDDQSIRAVGKWPWPRSYHALFLDALRQTPPRVVGYDLKFFSPTPEDVPFVQTAQYFDSVCFSYDLRLSDPAAARAGEETLPEAAPRDAEKILFRMALPEPEGDLSLVPESSHALLPAEAFCAFDLGFATAPRDADGVLRRLPLVLRHGDRLVPSLALCLAMRYLGLAPENVRVRLGRSIDLVRDGKTLCSAPVDARGRLLVKFYAQSAGAVDRRLYIQLMKAAEPGSAIPASAFEGRIVLAGHAATGSMSSLDVGATPLGPYEPYMYTHAFAVENILNGDYLRRVPRWLDYLAALLLSLLVGGACALMPPWAALAVFCGANAAWAGLNVALFVRAGVFLNLSMPVTLSTAVYLVVILYRLVAENRDKRFLKKVFGQYVSENVLNDILTRPGALKLGGEKKELTVLFADICGFTSLCERQDPELVVAQLNEYLDCMTEVIFRNNGTLDKYIGDCIMAIFGAPSTELCPDHAWRAVKSAVEMRRELARLQEAWRRAGREPLDIGVGINTGKMVVGNMGSSRVWDYTVIGDEVNLAARLESQTRAHQVGIIVSESTYLQVAGRVKARKLGTVKVKGKQNEVVIYAVEDLV